MWPCTKYISLKYHHFRLFMKGKTISIDYVDSSLMIANIFTKPSIWCIVEDDDEMVAFFVMQYVMKINTSHGGVWVCTLYSKYRS